jgi:hypothetical protein
VPDLIVKGGFDPSGIEAGVDRGALKLQEFQRLAAQVANNLPEIDMGKLLGGKKIDDSIEALKRLQGEALRTKAALTDMTPPSFGDMATILGVRTQAEREAAKSASALKEVMLQQGQAATRAASGNRAYALGIEQIAQANRRAVAPTRDLIEGMSASGRIGQTTEMMRKLGDVSLRTADGVSATGHAFEGGHVSATRFGRVLEMVAFQAAGVEGPLGRLAGLAVTFGGGEIALIGVAAAVAVLAGAYQFLTKARRDAEETQDKALAGLRSEAESAIPPVIKAHLALAAAIREEKEAREGLLLRAAKVAGEGLTLLAQPTQLGAAIAAEAQRRDQENATQAARDHALAVTAGIKAVSDFQQVNAKALTESIMLGTANSFQYTQAAGLVEILDREVQRHLGTLDEQAERYRVLIGLRTVLDAVPAAQRAGQAQIIASDLAARQQGLQAEQQALQDALDQQLITRQDFLVKSRALIVKGADADIEALRGKLFLAAAVQVAPGTAAATEKENNLRALQAEIDLRLKLRDATLAHNAAQQELNKSQIVEHGLPTAGVATLLAAPVVAELKLKPRIDPGEVQAAIASFEAATSKGLSDNEVQRALDVWLQLQPVLDEINIKLKDIGNADFTPWREQLSEVASIVGGVADALQATRDVIEGTGRDAGDAIGNVVDLGHSLSDLGSSLAHGDVFGAIASGINAIGSVGKLLGFGKSETELKLEQAVRDNAAAVRAMTKALLDQIQGAPRITQQRDIINRVLSDPAAQSALARSDTSAFSDALLDMGLTLDQVRVIAREYGISLVQDHHLVQGGADRLREALDLAAEAATHISKSYEAQKTWIDQYKTIFGGMAGQGPAWGASVDRNRLIGQLGVDPATKARVAALDLATEQGRAAYLEWIRQMATLGAAGMLTAEQLGQIPDVGTLLGDLADQTKALEDAQRAYTDAIRDAIQTALGDIAERNRFFPDRTPVATFGEQAAAASGLAPVIKQALLGLNATNAKDRQELLNRLFTLLLNSQTGALTKDQTGGLDAQDFQDLILELADTLNGIASAEKEAADAAKQAADEALAAARTAREQAATEAELRAALTGQSMDAASKFSREVKRLTATVPSFAKFFDGLDLTAKDPASKKLLQNKLLELMDQFGGTDFSALGISRDEFMQFLQDGADSLGLFTDQMNEATKSLFNFPTGINLAALEFEAQAAGAQTLLQSRPNDGAMLPSLTSALTSLAQSTPTSSLADLSSMPSGAGIFVTGNIYIYVTEAETDPLTLARRIADQARRTNLARTGDPTRSA